MWISFTLISIFQCIQLMAFNIFLPFYLLLITSYLQSYLKEFRSNGMLYFMCMNVVVAPLHGLCYIFKPLNINNTSWTDMKVNAMRDKQAFNWGSKWIKGRELFCHICSKLYFIFLCVHTHIMCVCFLHTYGTKISFMWT